LSINITDYAIINDFSDITQTSGGTSTRSSRSSFFNVFLNNLPNTRTAYAVEARVRSEERKMVLSGLLERLRAESEMRRHELYSKLLQNDEEEKPYDVAGKCMDIARRIMRGEKVSPEEMRLLSRYYPELLFQALLLRHEGHEEKDSDDTDSIQNNDALT